MGLLESWADIAATLLRARGYSNDSNDGDGGEGDSAGGPKPRGRNDWPTLVIEAGDSESLGELHNDIRWWFSASHHVVQIVLLAKFYRPERQILLEKWEEERVQDPPGPLIRSRAQAGILRPVRRQEIRIEEDPENPAASIITSGALVLGFRLLFLREPDAEKGEGDIVFSVSDLQRFAAHVWDRDRD
jgi:hypothetical protein